MLLYPGKNAVEPKHIKLDPLDDPVLIVLDGTWDQTEKLLQWNPELKQIPRVAFASPEPSEYVIRKEIENGLATCEAVAHCLVALGDANVFEAIMAPFRLLNTTQVAFGARAKNAISQPGMQNEAT